MVIRSSTALRQNLPGLKQPFDFRPAMAGINTGLRRVGLTNWRRPIRWRVEFSRGKILSQSPALQPTRSDLGNAVCTLISSPLTCMHGLESNRILTFDCGGPATAAWHPCCVYQTRKPARTILHDLPTTTVNELLDLSHLPLLLP
jgi:hypothetical protein